MTNDDQGLTDLLAVMARLRDPKSGCPWDIEQTFASIAPYTIEEAYEVADAIARNNIPDLKEELGDLLLQVVFHAQMATEQGLFDFNDVARAEAAKLIRRHPHVFGDDKASNASDVLAIWQNAKDSEKKASTTTGPAHTLDSITIGLPALMRAQKIHKKVARLGFDWPDAAPVLDKLEEEIGELREAMGTRSQDAMAEELGDVLFTLAVLAGHMGLDPEAILQAANNKFIRRFNSLEDKAREQGIALPGSKLEALDALWQQVKAAETSEQTAQPAQAKAAHAS